MFYHLPVTHIRTHLPRVSMCIITNGVKYHRKAYYSSRFAFHSAESMKRKQCACEISFFWLFVAEDRGSLISNFQSSVNFYQKFLFRISVHMTFSRSAK
jgi:hypothetical protein